MFLLNLSLAQFLGMFGAVAAVSVALYLLDRSRRRQVVSTLRFWIVADRPAPAARRHRVQQPWSLVLQLAGMGLLLLAVAQLQLGTPAPTGRDHVVILETSAWMAAKSADRSLMDTARQRARQYVQALPARDRVLLVRADALATPATPFEPDHAKVLAAVQASGPGATALNLDQALSFARHMQNQAGRRAGEIVFIGSGRTTGRDLATAPPAPRNLRVIPIPDSIENCGLRKIGVRRSNSDPDVWEIYVSAHNYGSAPHTVSLSLEFGTPQAAGRVAIGFSRTTVKPRGDAESLFQFRTTAAGILAVDLGPHDAFPADDHAEIELPAQPMLTVTVYSREPELLRPLLSATPRIAAVYRTPEEYRPGDRGLVILDRFAPPQRPSADSIWIDPPADGSPIPIRLTVHQAPFTAWDPDHSVSAGLRTKDLKLERSSVFETAISDVRVGEVSAGPVIVARDGKPKIAVLGFHPQLSAMRYELAAPLLFADLLRWVSPEIFRHVEIGGASVGSVKLAMDEDFAVDSESVKVTAEDGSALPFTLHGRTLEFFAGAPGSVRVTAGDREYLYSLTLPQLGDVKWEPPADARQGIPHFAALLESAKDVWGWLAVLGAAALLAEWLLYGRFRRGGRKLRPSTEVRA
jgi:hypothetical protein